MVSSEQCQAAFMPAIIGGNRIVNSDQGMPTDLKSILPASCLTFESVRKVVYAETRKLSDEAGIWGVKVRGIFSISCASMYLEVDRNPSTLIQGSDASF